MTTSESTDLIFINTNNFQQPLPENTNQLVLSSFTQVHDYETSRGISLKICLSEKERYILNNNELHQLTPGKYLLVNRNTSVESQIKTKTPCLGLCFYFNDDYLNQLIESYSKTPEQQIDSSDEIINDYTISEICLPFHPDSLFYKLLKQFIPDAASIDISNIKQHSTEIHFEAACFIAEQQNLFNKSITKLKQIKQSTKKEILQRLINAQHIIYENCCNPISITEIARQIGLSEFYFLRMYKQVFQISPHQHILQFRMAKAFEILKKSKASISDAALSCGFADLPSFSKAFKKRFGIYPTAIQKN